MRLTRSRKWIELQDVDFSHGRPAQLLVKGIVPANDTLALVALVNNTIPPTGSTMAAPNGTLFVYGTGETSLKVFAYDRRIGLQGVEPGQHVDVIRLYVMNGQGILPIETIGLTEISPL